ncbi:MAG: hypothetical protein NUW02_01295 [Candidatus Campbellbacteria bacterium]|nr:hypothetical protein [Candidatus Campbellbacteria bacterium]
MKKVTEKTKRRYAVFVFALLAVGLVGAYVWAILLTNQYHNQIILTQEELLVQVERERRVRDTAGVIASLKEEREVVKTFFKTPDDVISIIEEIEGFGRTIGALVSVVQVQVDDEDPKTREGTFVVSIFSTGSWKKMMNLIGLLDSLPYQAKASQITLDTSQKEGGSTTVLPWTVRASLSIVLKK